MKAGKSSTWEIRDRRPRALSNSHVVDQLAIMVRAGLSVLRSLRATGQLLRACFQAAKITLELPPNVEVEVEWPDLFVGSEKF